MWTKYCLAIFSSGLFLASCGKKPVADFTWAPEEPKVGQQVEFENLSIDAKSYSWNLGDLNISEETNPTHVYDEEGDYIVDLTAHNGLKSNEKTVTISVVK